MHGAPQQRRVQTKVLVNRGVSKPLDFQPKNSEVPGFELIRQAPPRLADDEVIGHHAHRKLWISSIAPRMSSYQAEPFLRLIALLPFTTKIRPQA